MIFHYWWMQRGEGPKELEKYFQLVQNLWLHPWRFVYSTQSKLLKGAHQNHSKLHMLSTWSGNHKVLASKSLNLSKLRRGRLKWNTFISFFHRISASGKNKRDGLHLPYPFHMVNTTSSRDRNLGITPLFLARPPQERACENTVIKSNRRG